MISDKDLQDYLADSPPSVVRLEIKLHFEALTDEQKLYAHHISRCVHFLEWKVLELTENFKGFPSRYKNSTEADLARIRAHLRLHHRTL